MKHPYRVLYFILGMFLLSQIFGLYLLSVSANVIQEEGLIQVTFEDTALGERPELQGFQTLWAVAVGILIGTIILLLFAKYKKVTWWKNWFFLATLLTISVSIGVILKSIWAVWIISIALTYWKVYRQNFWIHNFTELLVYSGITILLVPLLNVMVCIVMLLLISVYDAYAVWKSKHMISLAKFTNETGLFPGLRMNYTSKEKTEQTNKTKEKLIETKNTIKALKTIKENKQTKQEKEKTGILGGGDVVFPLIFSGTVMIALIELGLPIWMAFLQGLTISVFAGISLLILLLHGKKDSYYPAMPYISLGCFVGYIFIFLFNHLAL